MPSFAWAMLITAFLILFAFPPLILASILLEMERALGWPFFAPARGGDPLLWQHLFWFFGHPEVYIIFLPAAGLVSTVLPALVGRPIVGYAWMVSASAAIALISFAVWVHHMFAAGGHHLAVGFFSAASLAVAVPTGILVFGWIATLLSGRPRVTLPMLYLLGFFFLFVAGGLTGVMLAVVPFDHQVHDTHFVVAHFHYVLVGGQLFPLLAAAYYYLPLVSGRQPLKEAPDLPARLALGHGYLGFVRHGWLETLGVSMRSGRPEQCVRLPGPTYLPLATALVTGLFFLGILFKLYWLAAIGLATTIVLVLMWSRGTGLTQDHGALPVGNGLDLPPHVEAARPPSWWGMVLLLAADATVFASILYAAIYLPFVASGWPPSPIGTPVAWLSAAAATALVVAAAGAAWALRSPARISWLALAAGAQVTAILLLSAHLAAMPDPRIHAYGALLAALTAYTVLHAAMALVFCLYGLYRVRAGYVSARRLLDLRLVSLWQTFTAVTGMVALLTLHGLAHWASQ